MEWPNKYAKHGPQYYNPIATLQSVKL